MTEPPSKIEKQPTTLNTKFQVLSQKTHKATNQQKRKKHIPKPKNISHTYILCMLSLANIMYVIIVISISIYQQPFSLFVLLTFFNMNPIAFNHL
jgi:hypothetical protein